MTAFRYVLLLASTIHALPNPPAYGKPQPEPWKQPPWHCTTAPPSIVTVTATKTVTATVTTSSAYAFANDTTVYSALAPLPADVDQFTAFQKIAASTSNTTVLWWYEGLSSVIPAGLPETPGIKSQTLMAYRIRHLNSTCMRIDWTEIVALADFSSGEDIHSFYNSQSGNTANVSNYYYDGPVTYYITNNLTTGLLDLEIQQTSANVTKASIVGSLYNKQIQFTQVEQKTRAVVGEPGNVANLQTTLRFHGSLADVRNASIATAPASGYYNAFFNGTVSSIFGYPNATKGDTHILGNIWKGGAWEALYPKQWDIYLDKFPEFFKGGVVDPDWDSLLGKAGLPL